MKMKRLLTGALALIFSIAASATTFTPIQLLNPAGSTSGQAIISTGPTTVPAWGSIPATALAAQAANTVVANVTGSSASPTAFAMPSCSASGNNLQWTSGMGFTCATGYAQLASPTFTGTVTTAALTATGLITPSSTNGIKGTTTNDNANAGSVGEYISSTVVSGSAVPLTNNTVTNVTSISVTAGDWEVCGNVFTLPAGSTIQQSFIAAISTTSATLPNAPAGGGYTSLPYTAAAGFTSAAPTGCMRESFSATTTVFLVTQIIFSGSTDAAYGFIGARRVR
jgi:hypothetical protein